MILAASVAGGYGAARWKAIDFVRARFCALSAVSQNASFRPNTYPLKNLPFVVVIVGKNNGAYLEKNLRSVFSQCYENFRVIYVDDGSDDGSDSLASNLIENSSCSKKTHFVHCEQTRGVLRNIVDSVKECGDEEIVVVLHGDDGLAHEWVLQRLNQYYADSDLWITYSQCIEYPACQISAFRQYVQNGRTAPVQFPRLQTFYAGLFKQINDSDLRYQGEYIQGAAEIAYMLPMLEMAEGHFQCLSDVLYIASPSNIEDDREYRAFFEKYVRSLKSYEKIDSLGKD